MEGLLQQIEGYRKEIEGYEIVTPQQLEEYRIKFLGTKGLVKTLFGEMRNVPNERKKEFGQVLNEFKQFAEARLSRPKNHLQAPPFQQKKRSTFPCPVMPLPLVPATLLPWYATASSTFSSDWDFRLPTDLRSKMTGTTSLR